MFHLNKIQRLIVSIFIPIISMAVLGVSKYDPDTILVTILVALLTELYLWRTIPAENIGAEDQIIKNDLPEESKTDTNLETEPNQELKNHKESIRASSTRHDVSTLSHNSKTEQKTSDLGYKKFGDDLTKIENVKVWRKKK